MPDPLTWLLIAVGAGLFYLLVHPATIRSSPMFNIAWFIYVGAVAILFIGVFGAKAGQWAAALSLLGLAVTLFFLLLAFDTSAAGGFMQPRATSTTTPPPAQPPPAQSPPPGGPGTHG